MLVRTIPKYLPVSIRLISILRKERTTKVKKTKTKKDKKENKKAELPTVFCTEQINQVFQTLSKFRANPAENQAEIERLRKLFFWPPKATAENWIAKGPYKPLTCSEKLSEKAYKRALRRTSGKDTLDWDEKLGKGDTTKSETLGLAYLNTTDNLLLSIMQLGGGSKFFTNNTLVGGLALASDDGFSYDLVAILSGSD